MERRTFLATSVAGMMQAGGGFAASSTVPPLCIFSKHMAQLNYGELGKKSKEIGFDGVDLAVRPGGHVLPENVAKDLPRAHEAISGHGVSVAMITTGLLSGSDPAARPTVQTAGRLKIPYFKPGYWRYRNVGIEERLAEVKQATRGLIDLAQEYGVALGMHNHSGDYFGSPVWDTREVIAGADPKWAGYYFDPAHATIEGGLGGWLINTQMALPRIKMCAIKDFVWEKADGKWQVKWVPLGEGMVDFPRFFGLLAKAGFQGPLSLHVEYHTSDELAAIANDFAYMRKVVRKAYGVA